MPLIKFKNNNVDPVHLKLIAAKQRLALDVTDADSKEIMVDQQSVEVVLSGNAPMLARQIPGSGKNQNSGNVFVMGPSELLDADTWGIMVDGVNFPVIGSLRTTLSNIAEELWTKFKVLMQIGDSSTNIDVANYDQDTHYVQIQWLGTIPIPNSSPDVWGSNIYNNDLGGTSHMEVEVDGYGINILLGGCYTGRCSIHSHMGSATITGNGIVKGSFFGIEVDGVKYVDSRTLEEIVAEHGDWYNYTLLDVQRQHPDTIGQWFNISVETNEIIITNLTASRKDVRIFLDKSRPNFSRNDTVHDSQTNPSGIYLPKHPNDYASMFNETDAYGTARPLSCPLDVTDNGYVLHLSVGNTLPVVVEIDPYNHVVRESGEAMIWGLSRIREAENVPRIFSGKVNHADAQLKFTIDDVEYPVTITDQGTQSTWRSDPIPHSVFDGREVDLPIQIIANWEGTESRHTSALKVYRTLIVKTRPDVSSVIFADLNDCVIDWGDGSTEEVLWSHGVDSVRDHNQNVGHEYANAGEYTIEIDSWGTDDWGRSRHIVLEGKLIEWTSTFAKWTFTADGRSNIEEVLRWDSYGAFIAVGTRDLIKVPNNAPIRAKISSLLSNAKKLDQDLSGWCVPKVPNETIGFNALGLLTPEQLPVWGTCPTPFK